MNLRNPLFTAILLGILSFSIGLTSQGLTDGVKVTLPQPVTIGDMVLDPGEYEIRRASQTQDQVLQIFNNDKLRYETVVLTVPTLDNQTPEESKVVLQRVGDNFYFDKIWIEGKNYGYEFPLPDKVQALKRELAMEVPAHYEPAPGTAQPAQPAQPAVSSQQDQTAQQQADLQAQADTERQQQEAQAAEAERERQAQLERERQEQAERDRIASLQQNERNVAPVTPESRQAPAPSTQSQTETNAQGRTQDQLPATADNWLGFMLAGGLLLTLSALVRPSRRQE